MIVWRKNVKVVYMYCICTPCTFSFISFLGCDFGLDLSLDMDLNLDLPFGWVLEYKAFPVVHRCILSDNMVLSVRPG